MANVKDALHLGETGFFVIELGVEPIERVACGGFQAAFAGHGVFLKKMGVRKKASLERSGFREGRCGFLSPTPYPQC
jgi:hypothetical protein